MTKIKVVVNEDELDRVGNWDGPRALFPMIEVDQETATVKITYLGVSNRQRGQWGKTHWHQETLAPDGQVLRITGMTGLRNDRRHRFGGRQSFVFFVFRGDSGHLYTHRAVASKLWMECPPETLLPRLRKLGIGANDGVVQQGDFLLKPARERAYDSKAFAHETMGAGHHKFAAPVLYADGEHGRQYLTSEPITLQHEATDGIRHPDVTVPVGTWIVGTASLGLSHDNGRD